MRLLWLIVISLYAPLNFAAIVGCKNLTKEKAQSAYKILLDYKRGQDISVVDRFCVSCKDKYPHALVINELALITVGKSYQVTVNTKAIETSEIYLKGKNLAQMIECHTSRMPSNLYQ